MWTPTCVIKRSCGILVITPKETLVILVKCRIVSISVKICALVFETMLLMSFFFTTLRIIKNLLLKKPTMNHSYKREIYRLRFRSPFSHWIEWINQEEWCTGEVGTIYFHFLKIVKCQPQRVREETWWLIICSKHCTDWT